MSTISLVASKNTRLQLTHLLAEQRCRTKSGACPASPQPPRPPHAPRKVGSHWLGFCWPLDGTRPFKFRLKATHPAFLAPSDAQTGCNLEDPILAILAKRANKKNTAACQTKPTESAESQLVSSQLLGLHFQPLKRTARHAAEETVDSADWKSWPPRIVRVSFCKGYRECRNQGPPYALERKLLVSRGSPSAPSCLPPEPLASCSNEDSRRLRPMGPAPWS